MQQGWSKSLGILGKYIGDFSYAQIPGATVSNYEATENTTC